MIKAAVVVLGAALATCGGSGGGGGGGSTPTAPEPGFSFFATIIIGGTAVPIGNIMEGVLLLDGQELGRRRCPAVPPGTGTGSAGNCFPYILGPLRVTEVRGGDHQVSFDVVRQSELATGGQVGRRLTYTAVLTWGFAPDGAETFTTTQEPNRVVSVGPGDRVSWRVSF